MAFRVEIQPQAFEDLDSIADHIKSGSSFGAAESWFNGIMHHIATLQEMPSLCPVAVESAELGQVVRVLLHGRRNRTYKIYFSTKQDGQASGVVYVFHVRHWARKPVTDDELEELMDDQEDRWEA